MKKDQLLWIFVALLIVAGIAAAMWPQGLAEIRTQTSRVFGAPRVAAARVLFVGDIMLDRDVAVHARQAGDSALFGGVQSLFAGYDVLVGNLEGTITDNPSVAQVDHSILRFTFDPHYAKLLAGVGFSALSLANNHALDFGEFGYEDTVNYLAAQGISAFGSPFNEQHVAVRTSIHGQKFCFVGYHELFDPDPASVIAKLEEARAECSYVVLVAHWGVEYQHEPTAQQVALAHQFIDAGADVIIGGHPHVVEPLEIYNNKAIFYSLGNFIFDQHWKPEVKRGLTVGIEFGDTSTRFTLVPVTTDKEAAVADATTIRAVLSDVVTPDLSGDIANSIINTGSFELKN